MATLRDMLEGVCTRLTVLESSAGFGGDGSGRTPAGREAKRSPLLGGGVQALSAEQAYAEARSLLRLGGGGAGDAAVSTQQRMNVLRGLEGYGPLAAGQGQQRGRALSSRATAEEVRAAATRAEPGQDSQAQLAEAIRGLTSYMKAGKTISIEEQFGLHVGGATTEEEYSNLWGEGAHGITGSLKLGGAQALEKIRKTRVNRPDLVVVSHEKSARADLRTLPGESWSWTRHCEAECLEAAGTHKTLARVTVAVAAGLDEMRTGSLEQGQAFFHHLYRVLESTCKDPAHDLGWSYPILGVKDPGAPRPRTGWAPAESAALAAHHKEEHLMDQVRKAYGGGGKDGGKGDRQVEQEIQNRVNAELRKRKGKEKGDGRGRGGGGAANTNNA